MDKYVLHEKIGNGPYTVVYRASIINTNNIVAIKIINKLQIQDHQLKMLKGEIDTMKYLLNIETQHPNIVHVHDVIDVIDQVWFVMEYCDSGDLSLIMIKPCREKYVHYYMNQLIRGLRFLKNHNIIHRDIKPKNIMLTNNKNTLKIVDFGFSKIQIETHHNTLCGSPHYMAPELLRCKSYDDSVDLWAAGIIMYQMLFAKHPLEGCSTLSSLRENIINVHISIPPKYTKNKNITSKCLNVLSRLLTRNPIDRIKMHELFQHPWITENFTTLELELNESTYKTTTNSSDNQNIYTDIIFEMDDDELASIDPIILVPSL